MRSSLARAMNRLKGWQAICLQVQQLGELGMDGRQPHRGGMPLTCSIGGSSGSRTCDRLSPCAMVRCMMLQKYHLLHRVIRRCEALLSINHQF